MGRAVKVKICGNTTVEDVRCGIESGADYLGFIFVPSKRRIELNMAKVIVETFPNFVSFVGVFFNQPKEEVLEIAQTLKLKCLQFHGDETALYCKFFQDEGFEVIKTFRIKDAMSLKRIDDYDVSAFLFDTYSNQDKGGTGIPFDWGLIEDKAYVHEKLFLAGGLSIANVQAAINQVKPYAVDVASGVEKSPGVKNPELVKKFIQIAKSEQNLHASK